MIKITKQERDYLVNEMHVPCKENGVSKTLGKGRKKNYYLAETKKNLQFLQEYRESKISK